MSPRPEEGKADARTRGRAERRGIEAARRVRASEEACGRFLALAEVSGARSVLAYAATPEELDPAPMVRALVDRGVRVAYPRVCGEGAMTLHRASLDALATGYCGIDEPAADAPLVDPAEIDLVIVPGVAFDERCCRIGHGGGFYDRLLPSLRPDALRVGLAFDEQIADQVPQEAHDVRLDAVVTPTRVIRRS